MSLPLNDAEARSRANWVADRTHGLVRKMAWVLACQEDWLVGDLLAAMRRVWVPLSANEPERALEQLMSLDDSVIRYAAGEIRMTGCRYRVAMDFRSAHPSEFQTLHRWMCDQVRAGMRLHVVTTPNVAPHEHIEGDAWVLRTELAHALAGCDADASAELATELMARPPSDHDRRVFQNTMRDQAYLLLPTAEFERRLAE